METLQSLETLRWPENTINEIIYNLASLISQKKINPTPEHVDKSEKQIFVYSALNELHYGIEQDTV